MAFDNEGKQALVRFEVILKHNFFIFFRTPLMLAIENGHVDTVLYLIANGAIVNAHDIQGRTALHRGVSSCWLDYLLPV